MPSNKDLTASINEEIERTGAEVNFDELTSNKKLADKLKELKALPDAEGSEPTETGAGDPPPESTENESGDANEDPETAEKDDEEAEDEREIQAHSGAQAAEKAEADKKAEEAKKFPYSVAMGKSITSKKGILEGGSEVRAEWLSGGEPALKALVKAGAINENK